MIATKSKLRNEAHNDPHKRMMRCPVCGMTYSAHRCDYWDLPDDHIFKCQYHPETELELVWERTVIEDVEEEELKHL